MNMSSQCIAVARASCPWLRGRLAAARTHGQDARATAGKMPALQFSKHKPSQCKSKVEGALATVF